MSHRVSKLKVKQPPKSKSKFARKKYTNLVKTGAIKSNMSNYSNMSGNHQMGSIKNIDLIEESPKKQSKVQAKTSLGFYQQNSATKGVNRSFAYKNTNLNNNYHLVMAGSHKKNNSMQIVPNSTSASFYSAQSGTVKFDKVKARDDVKPYQGPDFLDTGIYYQS